LHSFTGKVHLLAEPDGVLDANVVVDLNRIVVRAADAEIGSWPHADVRITKKGDGIHLKADGEVLVLNLENSGFFLDLMGVNESQPSRGGRRRRKKPVLMPEPPPPAAEGSRSSYVGDEATAANFSDLRTKAAASYSDPGLPKWVAIGLGIALALVLVGAALNWGSARLLEPGSFPIARVLAGFGGLAGLVGLYLAFFDKQRVNGSAVAIAAGGVVLGIAYFYARAANLRTGFMLAVLGGAGLIVAGAIGVSGRGAAPVQQDDTE
jgi:hypothetical protein